MRRYFFGGEFFICSGLGRLSPLKKLNTPPVMVVVPWKIVDRFDWAD